MISCTEKGLKTEKRTYHFINLWWWFEPYRILIVDINGGLFDSAASNQICDEDGHPIYNISAIEQNGFGYITALHVSYEKPYKIQ